MLPAGHRTKLTQQLLHNEPRLTGLAVVVIIHVVERHVTAEFRLLLPLLKSLLPPLLLLCVLWAEPASDALNQLDVGAGALLARQREHTLQLAAGQSCGVPHCCLLSWGRVSIGLVRVGS